MLSRSTIGYNKTFTRSDTSITHVRNTMYSCITNLTTGTHRTHRVCVAEEKEMDKYTCIARPLVGCSCSSVRRRRCHRYRQRCFQSCYQFWGKYIFVFEELFSLKFVAMLLLGPFYILESDHQSIVTCLCVWLSYFE